MSFIRLFSVRVKHDYYANTECRDLAFKPTQKTQQIIEGHRLRLQELADGISVWAQASADNKTPLIALQQDVVFVFHLYIRNADFKLFTDLEAFTDKLDPVYRYVEREGKPLRLGDRESWQTETFVVPANTAVINFTLAGNPLPLNGNKHKHPQTDDFSIEASAKSEKIVAYDVASKAITIQSKKQKQDSDFSLRYRVKPVRDKNILADVELHYDKTMAISGNNNEPLEIKFKARAGRWAYYLLTDQAGEFSIVDLDKSLVFNEVDMPDTADEDPLADALSQQYPALRRVRFLSHDLVKCSSEARKGIELRLGGERVHQTMPNPSIRHFSRLKQKVRSKLKEQDTLYQVVKHLRAP